MAPETTATTVADPAAAEVKAMSDYSSALTRWARDFAADFDDEGDKALTFKDPYGSSPKRCASR